MVSNLSVGTVNVPAMRYILGYYTLDYLHSGVNSILTCSCVFDYNISHSSALNMKKELFAFVWLPFLLL